jgi:ATP-dependent Lhr-like helicase
VWAATGGEPRRAQATFFHRGEGQLFLPADEPATDTLSDHARRALEVLRAEGACSAAELRGALATPQAQLDGALVELVLAGLVTNDHQAALRRVLAGDVGQAEAGRGVESSLDAELDAWKATRVTTSLSRPPASRMRQARREVAQRVAVRQQSSWPGQWSLLRRLGVLGAPLSDDERAARQARVLLQRVGIVTRVALEREPGPFEWGALYRQLQLMEMRGDVRRGYFVLGLPGVQFALPEAVEALRAWDQPEAEGGHPLVLLNACDPAAVYGASELPADAANLASALARLPSNYLVLRHGVALLTYEHGSARWTALPQAGDDLIARAVQLALAHLTRMGGLCSRPRRVFANEWNGTSPLGGAAQPLLEGLGFRREPPGMVWDGI